MSDWYWKDGTPASVPLGHPDWDACMRAIEEKLRDLTYKVIKQETLPGGYWISTVWLGLDHRFGSPGPPIIFETMIFDSKESMSDLCMERYSTEDEARIGHEMLKAEWTERLQTLLVNGEAVVIHLEEDEE